MPKLPLFGKVGVLTSLLSATVLLGLKGYEKVAFDNSDRLDFARELHNDSMYFSSVASSSPVPEDRALASVLGQSSQIIYQKEVGDRNGDAHYLGNLQHFENFADPMRRGSAALFAAGAAAFLFSRYTSRHSSLPWPEPYSNTD